jgi:cullin 1
MKARKTMKNQALIQEVISQISQRFAPKIPDIKKAIDTLLEKEYIERVEGTRDTFNYVRELRVLCDASLLTNTFSLFFTQVA